MYGFKWQRLLLLAVSTSSNSVSRDLLPLFSKYSWKLLLHYTLMAQWVILECENRLYCIILLHSFLAQRLISERENRVYRAITFAPFFGGKQSTLWPLLYECCFLTLNTTMNECTVFNTSADYQFIMSWLQVHVRFPFRCILCMGCHHYITPFYYHVFVGYRSKQTKSIFHSYEAL